MTLEKQQKQAIKTYRQKVKTIYTTCLCLKVDKNRKEKITAEDEWNIYENDWSLELLVFQDRIEILSGQWKNYIQKFGA